MKCTFLVVHPNIPKKQHWEIGTVATANKKCLRDENQHLLSLTLSLWLMGVYERINHQ
jgi:hypothetical protein